MPLKHIISNHKVKVLFFDKEHTNLFTVSNRILHADLGCGIPGFLTDAHGRHPLPQGAYPLHTLGRNPPHPIVSVVSGASGRFPHRRLRRWRSRPSSCSRRRCAASPTRRRAMRCSWRLCAGLKRNPGNPKSLRVVGGRASPISIQP